jgi:hypothetical protein
VLETKQALNEKEKKQQQLQCALKCDIQKKKEKKKGQKNTTACQVLRLSGIKFKSCLNNALCL